MSEPRALLHTKIRNFLVEQFSLRESRQCGRLDLLYARLGYRDESLRVWTRDANPEVFEPSRASLAQLVSEIIEIAEAYTDSYESGSHRFLVITKQLYGGSARLDFRLQPGRNHTAVTDIEMMNEAIQFARQIASTEVERYKTSGELAAQDEWAKVIEAIGLVDQLVARARETAKAADDARTGVTLAKLVAEFGKSLSQDQIDRLMGILGEGEANTTGQAQIAGPPARCEFCEAVCRQVEDPERRNPCPEHGTPWLERKASA